MAPNAMQNGEFLKVGAAYIRVSSDDQLEYSPESQLKLIREHAKREGYIVPDEYVYQDDGISGKKAEKRPAFRMMIAMSKEADCPFSVIFVWKFSRFARNQEESIVYKNLLAKNGISVRSISEPYSDSPFNSLIERIIEWMDEYYLINLAGEVKRGMTEKASRGEPMSVAPFGYELRDKEFIKSENAWIIEDVFHRWCSGEGLTSIARSLNERGIRTTRGNRINNRWVEYVLTNPVYIGKIRWCTDGRASSSHYKNVDPEKIIISDGKHKPIIDMETWDAAQLRLQEQKRRYGNRQREESKHQWMLRGLCRCSTCGSTLVYVNTKPNPTMQCHKYSKGQCKTSHALTLRTADRLVIEGLENAVHTLSFQIVPKETKKKPDRPDYAKLIKSEESRFQRANEAYLAGVYDLNSLASVKKDVEENISRLRTEMELVEELPVFDANAYAEKVSDVLDILRSDASPESKNIALRTIIDKIVYDKSSSNLVLYFYA